jgi:large subunit ribosomal protein L22
VVAKAVGRYIRVSPQKARLVIDLIRGKPVEEALNILEYSPKAVARIIAKILRSAIANAEENSEADVDALYISQAFADDGPTQRRYLPRAMGRATPIRKRSSHITIILDEKPKE